jgi:putative transposase
MVDREHAQLSVRKQCQMLGIWRSNVYYCAQPVPDESTLANEIHDLWLDMPYYGYRRITAELRKRGYNINHKRIVRMMRDMRIQALYPKPRISVCDTEHKKYPYLLRDLEIRGPNHVWQTDITYIRMPEGFAYLVGIIDVFSRFLVAWSLSNTLETDFCLAMLENALKIGKPEIINTDQGVQFTSHLWTERVEQNDIKVSMDGVGRWADNIIIERFWRTLKHEHLLLHGFQTVKEVHNLIGRFIHTYNHKRLHQSLGYKTPAEIYLT